MEAEIQKMYSLLLSHIKPCLIGIAVKYDICDHLSEKAMNAQELAEITKTDQTHLNRLLRGLVWVEVLKAEENDKYSVTKFGETLKSNTPFSLKNWAKVFTTVFTTQFEGLSHSIKTGEPAFDSIYGQSFYDFLKTNNESNETFAGAMLEFQKINYKHIHAAFEFTKYRRIIDVGGGPGGFIRYILAINEHATGIVFDVEHVIKQASMSLIADFGERCVPISGDFFVSVPSDGDCYVLQKVIWNWNDEKALKILQNIREQMNEKTKLLIIEPTIEEELGVPFDMLLMAQMAGIVRSTHEFRQLLAKAALRLNRVISVDNTFVSIIDVSVM